jgi:hypothetical protein
LVFKTVLKNGFKPAFVYLPLLKITNGVKTESKEICHLKLFKIEFNDF